MLVDVVPMRRKGTKLPMSEVKGIKPVRGVLTLDVQYGHAFFQGMRTVPEQIIIAKLTNEKLTAHLLPELDHVRVPKLRGDSFVVFGFEQFLPKMGSSEAEPAGESPGRAFAAATRRTRRTSAATC